MRFYANTARFSPKCNLQEPANAHGPKPAKFRIVRASIHLLRLVNLIMALRGAATFTIFRLLVILPVGAITDFLMRWVGTMGTRRTLSTGIMVNPPLSGKKQPLPFA